MDKATKDKDVAAEAAEHSEVATDAADASMEKRKPATTIRVEDCSASIWIREYLVSGKPELFYWVTLERSYRDRDGTRKYTRSFDPESLGKVVSLCQKASEAIDNLKQQDAAQ